MRSLSKLLLGLALFFTLGQQVWADDFFEAWSNPQIKLKFKATGKQSGDLLKLEVRNEGKKTVKFFLPRFTILEPASSRYSPIVVESKGAWELPGGRYFSIPVKGFTLKSWKAVPKKNKLVKYTPSVGGKPYSRYQTALKKARDFEKKQTFGPRVLPKSQHRTMVLQRVIWVADGKKNPKTLDDLITDLESAMIASGKDVREKAIKTLAASIWRDVEKIVRSF